jgi:hypothetical protein
LKIERVLFRKKACWLQVDEILVSSEGGRESVCGEGTLIYGEFLCDEILSSNAKNVFNTFLYSSLLEKF